MDRAAPGSVFQRHREAHGAAAERYAVITPRIAAGIAWLPFTVSRDTCRGGAAAHFFSATGNRTARLPASLQSPLPRRPGAATGQFKARYRISFPPL